MSTDPQQTTPAATLPLNVPNPVAAELPSVFIPRLYIPGIPSAEQQRALKQGDFILVRHRAQRRIYFFHHAMPAEDSGIHKLYGVNLGTWHDSRGDMSIDLIESCRMEPNPEAAVSMLRAELLKSTATIANFMAEISFDEEDWVWTQPNDGAVRAVLYNGCPFKCDQGLHDGEQLPLYKDTCADFLRSLSPEAREVALDLVDHSYGVHCPGCLGYDLARRNLERELEEKQAFREIPELEDWRQRMEQQFPGLNSPDGVRPSDEVYEPFPEMYVRGIDGDELTLVELFGVSNLPLYASRPDLTERWIKWLVELLEAYAQLGYGHIFTATRSTGTVVLFFHAVRSPPHGRAASRKQLEKLLVAKYDLWQIATERVIGNICAICHSVPYGTGDKIVGLSCHHFFHKECLWYWLSEHDDCPTCRKKLSAE